MSSRRDVSADPTRTVKASASQGDRRPRKAAGRAKPPAHHADYPSQERFDQAVNSLRLLAQNVSHSAQDELAHILAPEMEDHLSFIMDVVEQDVSGLSTDGTEDHPQSSPPLKPADRVAPLPRRTQQYQVHHGSAPVRWRTLTASLLVTTQVAVVAVLIVSVAPSLLSGRQNFAEVRGTEAIPGIAKESSGAAFDQEVPRRLTRADVSEASSSNVQVEKRRVSGTATSPKPDHDGTPEEEPRPSNVSRPTVIKAIEGAEKPPSPGKREPYAGSSEIVGQQLLQRAEMLLRNRDISGARLVLERAVSLGSATAASQLAQTYDPSVLDGWQVRGITGDKAKSQELHELARILGLRESSTPSASR